MLLSIKEVKLARRAKKKEEDVEAYRHETETRKNVVPAGLASYDTVIPKPKQYAYDPHLDPQLVWTGKAENTSFEVPTVSLHIHERIAPEAIIRSIRREPAQFDLFAKPDMPLKELVEFYQHDMDWTNRLILGDSLLVMNSLLERELMAGKVQCIFVDPPYGVKFSSNFQPSVKQRDVKDQDEFMVREPEQIKAYRDTWELGIHSYLSYLRDRLLLSRDLLTDSGSIFVQIGDENVHLVRNLMDEIFGKKNFITQFVFKKTGSMSGNFVSGIFDTLLWYGKNVENTKFRKLYVQRSLEAINSGFPFIELEDGECRRLTFKELNGDVLIPKGKRFQSSPVMSSGASKEGSKAIDYEGKAYFPTTGRHWSISPEELLIVGEKGRLYPIGNTLTFKKYLDEVPYTPLTNIWLDTMESTFAVERMYVVQTNVKVIERCLLMTTDPGDLVLDPTCGSGTTVYVAEQWGRRWITCDTSRVALTIARQRLMTAVFPYYKLADEEMGVKGGFIYEEVPHITLKSIAQNEPHDKETLFDKPEIDRKKIRVSGPFTVEGIPQLYATERDEGQVVPETITQYGNAENHINTLIELLRKDGVTFPANKRMKFENFIPVSGGFIHAEGEPIEKNGLKKVAVSFGPPHGPVTLRQVEDGIREAHINGYDGIIFCGFAFDSSAMDVKHPKVKVFYSHIRPDVLVGDLLKTTASSQLFTVFGEPDIEITPLKSPTLAKGPVRPDLPGGGKGGFSGDIEYQIILKGVDIYDPLTGEVYSDNGDRIAAWFIDTDYDKRAFCISQAFFPDSSAWDKLKRALKTSIDEDKFELLTTTRSLPFKLGKEKRIAVKVIDHRGNEVMVVREIGGK
jgi:adenine-specific DNA-methyltransferase